MALDHFYTIKDKKKINILGAIERCMQKFDYDELSINDIVTEADISRGSFYNYFYDKSDAVETLVKEKTKIIFSIFKECIIENDGRLLDGAFFICICIKFCYYSIKHFYINYSEY